MHPCHSSRQPSSPSHLANTPRSVDTPVRPPAMMHSNRFVDLVSQSPEPCHRVSSMRIRIVSDCGPKSNRLSVRDSLRLGNCSNRCSFRFRSIRRPHALARPSPALSARAHHLFASLAHVPCHPLDIPSVDPRPTSLHDVQRHVTNDYQPYDFSTALRTRFEPTIFTVGTAMHLTGHWLLTREFGAYPGCHFLAVPKIYRTEHTLTDI